MSRILLCQSVNSELGYLESALTKKDHAVVVLSDVASLEGTVGSDGADLAIVDACGDLDEYVYCQALNQAWPSMPLILLIPADREADTAYAGPATVSILQQPFTARKVTNRVDNLLCEHPNDVLQTGKLVLNVPTRCVHRGDDVHRLTPKQARLLQVFMQHSGKTLTRQFLMEQVWETNYMGDTRTLDVHVRWIREHIEENPSSPRYLRTVRGVGYRFAVPPEDADYP